MDPQGELLLRFLKAAAIRAAPLILLAVKLITKPAWMVYIGLQPSNLSQAARQAGKTLEKPNRAELTKIPNGWLRDRYTMRCIAAAVSILCLALPWTSVDSGNTLAGWEIVARIFTNPENADNFKTAWKAYIAMTGPAAIALILTPAAFVMIYLRIESETLIYIHTALALCFLPVIFMTSALTEIGASMGKMMFVNGIGVMLMTAIHIGLMVTGKYRKTQGEKL